MKKFAAILIMLALSCITATAQFTIKKVPSKNVEKCIAHAEELSIFADENGRHTLHISNNGNAAMKLSMGNSREECERLILNLQSNLARLKTGEEVLITDSATKSVYRGKKSDAGLVEEESLILESGDCCFRFRVINLGNLSKQMLK